MEKYGGGRKILEIFHSKTGASHIWQGLVKILEALGTTRWRVRNGRHINFQMDRWIGNLTLQTLVKLPLMTEDLKKIAEYWVEERGGTG